MNRINIVCLGVRDMERSIKFYKDGLGFKTKEQNTNPPVIFFNANAGVKLELFPIELLVKDINNENPPTIGNGFCGITLAYNAKTKDEVDQVINLAKKAGAKIEKEPQEVFWGGYHGYFSDLDGYYWEVAYGPSFEFDDNGMLLDI